MHTPFFPSWHPQLAPMRGRRAHTFQTVRAYTLCQLEERFASYLPPSLFPKAAKQANSRDRNYTRPRTFWSMLWQGFNPKASGRLVVRQIQALFQLHAGPGPSEQDGACCRAKARLALKEFPKALQASAQAADRLAPALTLLRGRSIKLADGSTFIAPDNPASHCDIAWAGALATHAHTEAKCEVWAAVCHETCWFDGREYHPYELPSGLVG